MTATLDHRKSATGGAASGVVRPSRRLAPNFLEGLCDSCSTGLLLRAIVVAAVLSGLSLVALTVKREEPVRAEKPSRGARLRAPASAIVQLARAAREETHAGEMLDSDFSIEQAALTWSHRLDREEEVPGAPGLMRFGSVKVQKSIVERVVKAAQTADMDPVLLMAIADKESNFSTTARAKTSSASGLFQFVEKTWLQAVKAFGERHGQSEAARAIASADEEDANVSSNKRAKILNLRNDPYLSAALAAEILKKESARIAGRIGRALTAGETYLVHFLGPDDAERFIKTAAENPKIAAAALFPKPARANRPIFFDEGGGVKSVGEVHEAFESMMGKRTSRYGSVAAQLPPGVTAYAE